MGAELPIVCPECGHESTITDPNQSGVMSVAGVLDGTEVYAEAKFITTTVQCPRCAHVWDVEITTINLAEEA